MPDDERLHPLGLGEPPFDEVFKVRNQHRPPARFSGHSSHEGAIGVGQRGHWRLRDRVQSAYLMPPLGRYELALEVLDGLKR
jgi:hypothetical protein